MFAVSFSPVALSSFIHHNASPHEDFCPEELANGFHFLTAISLYNRTVI
jgi:hypothetical protein